MGGETPRPDILVSADGYSAALRGSDGRLSVLHTGRDTFAIKDWLAADADPRGLKDKTLRAGVRCDALGCIGRSERPAAVYELSPAAFAEDCARTNVVISRRSAPGACAAKLIDRNVWRARGAVTLRWDGDRFIEEAARATGYRPALVASAAGRDGKAHDTSPEATPKPEVIGGGGLSRGQYRRNSPTSLPWMRTRLGGRMRTS